MNYLHVYARLQEPTRCRVAYSCRRDGLSGVVEVTWPRAASDATLVAELVVLRYLLSVAGVAGRERQGGAGLQLTVSHGAIRKLQRQSSAKQTLAPWAQFLQTRYLDAEIGVAKQPSWAAEMTRQEPSLILPAQPVLETLATPLGAVALTQHALERFIERGTRPGCNASQAYISLQRLAASAECREVVPVPSQQRAWEARHGQRARFLLHDATRLCLAIGSGYQHQPTLLSCYRLDESDRLAPVKVYRGAYAPI